MPALHFLISFYEQINILENETSTQHLTSVCFQLVHANGFKVLLLY